VKAGGKQRNRLSGIEDSESLPVGSPAGQNEPTVFIGSQTKQREPIGDKNRISSLALRKAVFAGLGEDRGCDVMGREPRSMGKRSCA
jgi:hypothetical protein